MRPTSCRSPRSPIPMRCARRIASISKWITASRSTCCSIPATASMNVSCASSSVSDRKSGMPNFDFFVNGRRVSVSLDNEETPLLNVLRNELGLVGTRFGCGLEQCGCCMVFIDGQPEKWCAQPVWSVARQRVVTVEGLGTPEPPHPLQTAFLDEQAGQCGYCLSGILISAKALLDKNPSPTRAEIAAALDDNICRCGSHNRIMRAVEKAAVQARAGARA